MKATKNILIFLFFFIPFFLIGQKNDVFKSTLTYKDTLELDYYNSRINQESKKPLLILMHGGGFASGNRDGANEAEFCESMAKKGYPVVSIDYRLTRKNDPFNCDCDTEKKMASFIAASEDLAAAIKFLNEENSLNFDRTSIVLIGSSAGAEAILHAIFMANDYRFKHIPTFQISGLVSFAGAISNASYITKNNAVPTLFIHAKKDILVPFNTAPHHYCEENKTGYLILDGSKTISEQLTKYNTSFILAYNAEGGHEWADTAYLYTDLVDRFIKDLVLGQKNVQTIVELETAQKSLDSLKQQ